ncbi:hypothetical protein [Agrococcus beijingensis]|uniref:hypothetical protein n=1 Tax=Agrococcus beijingensis TaxID=3068634 RepID=UPI002741572D|nr:hypothetical protein [Agrococcus sp. REN33]
MSDERMRDPMPADDELRRRLQELPGPGGPSARLDVAAAVEGARRRRRPKVAAVTAAATGAGVLILAPFVVPGLTPLSPTSSTVMGEAEQDAGAAPEAAQPTDSGTDATEGGTEAGATFADQPCGLTRAGDIGMTLRFVADPADASLALPGSVEAEGAGVAATVVTFVDVAALEVTGSTASAVAGSTEQDARLAAGDRGVLEVTTGVLAADACGPGNPSAPSPVAIVLLDGAGPVTVVGEPWDVR